MAPLVHNNFYVDNYIDSIDSEDEAISRSKRLTELLALGSFRLTKWISSSRKVMSGIDVRERMDPSLNMDFEKLPTERMLGLLWDAEVDQFKFVIKSSMIVNTKREVLSEIAGIFDPLGLLSPVILIAKYIMQLIWRLELDWDGDLPDSILCDWKKWVAELSSVASIRIPRCVKGSLAAPDELMLHVFSDASERGYGAVVYCRATRGAHVQLSLVMAKSRVSPISYVTIPRLELQGALAGVRLAKLVCQELRLSMSTVTFWTDSMTVFQWINSKTYKFQTFVANRVAEILEVTKREQWRHVPGILNPADCCSRGGYGSQLTSCHIWFTGPPFLLSLNLTGRLTTTLRNLKSPRPNLKLHRGGSVTFKTKIPS